MQKHLIQTVSERGNPFTYEELIVYTDMFAEKLKFGECCAIYCKSELAAAIALLGCFAAGITCVPLSPYYDPAYITSVIDLINPTSMVTDVGGKYRIYDISDSKYEADDIQPALIICTPDADGVVNKYTLNEKDIITNISSAFDYMSIARPLYQVNLFLKALVNGERIDFYSGA